jgi:hypothetical protein
MLSPQYYRVQAGTCLRMSKMSSDPVLADRLNVLAAEFLAAAEDPRAEPEFRSLAARDNASAES